MRIQLGLRFFAAMGLAAAFVSPATGHAKLACQGSTTEWRELGALYVVGCSHGKQYSVLSLSARDSSGKLRSVSVRSNLPKGYSGLEISSMTPIRQARDRLKAGKLGEAKRLLARAISIHRS